MEAKKKRITLELAPEVQERLQAAAARKGVSLGQYCRAAIDKELAKDEPDGALRPRRMTIEDVIAWQKKTFGDRILPGSSVDLIHEAREERDASDGKLVVAGYVVVDASLAVKWLVVEEHTQEANALARHWSDRAHRW